MNILVNLKNAYKSKENSITTNITIILISIIISHFHNHHTHHQKDDQQAVDRWYAEVKHYTFGQEPRGGQVTGNVSRHIT